MMTYASYKCKRNIRLDTSERGKLSTEKTFRKGSFGCTNNPEFVLENEMNKILWRFVIQTDHLIPVRRQDPMIDKKREPDK